MFMVVGPKGPEARSTFPLSFQDRTVKTKFIYYFCVMLKNPTRHNKNSWKWNWETLQKKKKKQLQQVHLCGKANWKLSEIIHLIVEFR